MSPFQAKKTRIFSITKYRAKSFFCTKQADLEMPDYDQQGTDFIGALV